MNYKYYNYQIFCQINLFKHHYKIIFFFILIFTLGCNNKINKVHDLVSIDRFEEKFFSADSDSLDKLINDYPFLFPANFNKEEWINIKKDSLRKFIFNQTIKKYDDKKLNREISELYSNLSNEFSGFNSPKIITLNNGIDYQYKIISTDSLVLLSLDCYLGSQSLYKNIPSYISQRMSEEFLMRDLAEKLISNHVIYPKNRQFISKIIHYGKIYNLMITNLDFDETKALNYNEREIVWAKNNEKEVWKFFIENEILFNTSNTLEERFINFGPYSKFGISIDYESAPMIGRWIGYKIVKSYLKSNNKTIEEILNMNEYELYLYSNYKPGL
tara:strand:+ start:1941 stop:2927 length:987 start_codon:yes stop_codon:yes gene_type:complete